MEPSTPLSFGLPTQLPSELQLKGATENKNQDVSFSFLNEAEENDYSFEAGLKFAEAQKLCKYASANAVTHEGIPAAMEDLEKAMCLLHSVRNGRAEDCNHYIWKPERHVRKHNNEKGETEEAKTKGTMKFVRSILNKVTSSNFDTLLTMILVKCRNIDTEERLACIAEMLYEKAVNEPMYSATYGKMCQCLVAKEVTSSTDPTETINFRKLLLRKCQRQFESDSAEFTDIEKKKKAMEENKDEAKKKELEDEIENLSSKYQRKSIGNIRFIGELFKVRILSVKIMHQCIARLLAQFNDELSLEQLCVLLAIIGKDLEKPMSSGAKNPSSSNQEQMNSYFDRLETIASNRNVSNQIRFKIQDVIDLRKNQWEPRHEESNHPKPITIRERGEQERKRASSRPNDDGCNMVNNSNRGNTKMDMKQLRIPKAQTGDSDVGISLGPGARGMGAWGRGASGGMSQSMIGGRSAAKGGGDCASRVADRYLLLEDGSSTKHVYEDKDALAGRSSLGNLHRPMTLSVGRSKQEYRTMAGSTKSAFFPPKDGDRERGFDSSVRIQTPLGLDGRTRSQQSSRENSVTRPQRVAPQHLPLVREPYKNLLEGVSTVTEDQIARKAHSVLEEFFTNENIENAILDLKEWLHPSTVSTFINECLMHVLERNRKERNGTGTLLKEMLKRKLFTNSQVLNGFELVLQTAEDFLVDIPKLWEYLAQMVEPIFEEGVVNIGFLGQLADILSPAMAPSFVAATLKELVNAPGGVAGAERLWITSNTSLSSILPGVDVTAFVDQHKELEFIREDSTLRSTSSVGKVNVKEQPVATALSPALVYAEFQRNLEHFLRGSKRSTKKVSCWIQNQPVEVENLSFIRALATAVIQSSIDGNGTESKLNSVTLKDYSEVLRRFVENVIERELQLLYAAQSLVTQRQHPKGLLQGIFETLYDGNVVSEEGFESWATSDDPSEREGKAIALKSVKSFMSWLKEADPDSDQEANG